MDEVGGEQKEAYIPLEKQRELLIREIDRRSRLLFTSEKIGTLDSTVVGICEYLQKKVCDFEVNGCTQTEVEEINALSSTIKSIGEYRNQLFALENPARNSSWREPVRKV